jgi:hypothetical protein
MKFDYVDRVLQQVYDRIHAAMEQNSHTPNRTPAHDTELDQMRRYLLQIREARKILKDK